MILRKSLAGLAVALLAGAAVACGGSGGGGHGHGGHGGKGDGGSWAPLAKGQAAQVLDFSAGGRDAGTRQVAFYGFSGSPAGLTTAADGSVYGLGQKLIRLEPDRKVAVVTAASDAEDRVSGVVALPDGSLVVGVGSQVKKIAPGGVTTVLAGAAGAARASGAPVPASAAAAGFSFAATPSPVGVGRDGAVLITDEDVLWSLDNGTLKRLYRITGKGPDALPLRLGPESAVDGSGTAYLTPEELGPRVPGLLEDVLAVSPDGVLSKPLVPARIAGLPGAAAKLNVRWLAGDGADGVFAQVYDPSGGNGAVVHLHAGRADLVAHENEGAGAAKPCRIPKPVDALHLPCPLPGAMAYRSGSLFLGGLTDYVLQIRVS
ncbi:hypothetical protein [Streptomyces sp. NBC_01190]|uniref:hypothetical protein n=1 Tax=Streptomyces sp. NBC_01190 TaxID=2903767 RepID=UPI00386359FD|nr:hypothetical protein OG519_09330 [Streptomyces sp. NBC_01190]